jgi:hypothetical protein
MSSGTYLDMSFQSWLVLCLPRMEGILLRCLLLGLVAFVIYFGPAGSTQQVATHPEILRREYTDGTVTHYRMTGDNDGWQYKILAADTVKRDAGGRYYEEIQWSDLTSNAHQALTPASLALRQTVSLDDPSSYMKMPNLASVQPLLIGPITDTLTLYSDLLLAMNAKLVTLGQSAYVSGTTPNSWADGERVILGQDTVDFSIKLESINSAEHTETLLIQHVPPPALHIALPAAWMREAAAAKPDNFVQVSKQGDGFEADTGKEFFDVRLVVDTRDGQIISATIHNPVQLKVRECKDRELTQCGPATPKTTLREITWNRVP